MIACLPEDNSFRNVNLTSEEANWASRVMNDVCTETGGNCCTGIEEEGGSELETGFAGSLSAGHCSKHTFIGMRQTTITVDKDKYFNDVNGNFINNDNVKTYKDFFARVLKHELIHHCSRRHGHLAFGNVMCAGLGCQPADGKLTKDDLLY